MYQVHYDNTHSVGMGDLLCFISLICSSPDPVEILVSNEHGTYDTLCNMKRVLNIPDHRFTLSLSIERGQFPNYGWPLKLFSPYYRPELVNIFGKDIPVKGAKPSKGYIGLVCYNGSGQYMNDDYHMVHWNHDRTMITGKEVVWPQVRYRPVSYYTRLFEYFKTHDYDVITLDSNTTLFDEKVELMVKYCRAIVGFEGGIAHLSHMLGIPYFMLNWRLPSPSTANGDLHCELVHMSPHLYMLRDDEEIFSWDKAELSHQIYQTELGMGNNRFITGEHQFKFDANTISGNIRVTDDKGNEILDMGKLFDNNVMHQFLRKCFNDSHITSKFGKW